MSGAKSKSVLFTHISEVDKLCNQSPVGPLKFQTHGVVAHVRRNVLLNHVAALKQKRNEFIAKKWPLFTRIRHKGESIAVAHILK